MSFLKATDPEIYEIIHRETERQAYRLSAGEEQDALLSQADALFEEAVHQDLDDLEAEDASEFDFDIEEPEVDAEDEDTEDCGRE